MLNTCYNALDRHVEEGYGEQTTIIHDSPVSNTIRKISYREFRDHVSRFAGVLKNFDVKRGDTVVIYMPMVSEALIAMLACARIGAIHSVVFGGFAPKELAIRINDANPKVIVSASCGIEGKRLYAINRFWMRQSILRSTSRIPALSFSDHRCRLFLLMAAIMTGNSKSTKQIPRIAFRYWQQILSIFSTHPEQRENRRVWYVIMVGMPSH